MSQNKDSSLSVVLWGKKIINIIILHGKKINLLSLTTPDMELLILAA